MLIGTVARRLRLKPSVRQRHMTRRPTRATPLRIIAMAVPLAMVPLHSSVAKVAPAKLSEVIARSELIFVGTVSSVMLDTIGEQVATVAVENVWHGAPGTTIRVSLQPTWTCDSSTATAGERAIFFLVQGSDNQWHYAHSGHGRMPIVEAQAVVSPMVLLPDEARVREGGTRQVRLDVMEGLVRTQLKKGGPGKSTPGPA